MSIKKVSGPNYDKGTMYRSPADYWTVEFDDGEVVDVRTGDGAVTALGLCYQHGRSHEVHGRLAEAAVRRASIRI